MPLTRINSSAIATGAVGTSEISDGQVASVDLANNLALPGTDSVTVPKGTTAQRNASHVTGMTRYNTTTNKFEGYNGSWVELSTSLTDSDNDTYITAENTPGANDNIIRFYNSGSLTASLDATKFSTNKLEVDDIEIDGSTITTISTNTDLNLNANGTGSVVFRDDFTNDVSWEKIKKNTLLGIVGKKICKKDVFFT